MDTAVTPRNFETRSRRRGIFGASAIGHERLASVENLPTSNLAVAVALAEAGVAIFPADASIVPTRKDPDKISKAPLIAAWRDNSTSDLKQIRRWWSHWPNALPAIDCGKSGLLVLGSTEKGD